MVEKLIVVIMGPGKRHFAEMCLDSVKDADEILYWTSVERLPIWNMNVSTYPFVDIHYPESDKEILIMKNDWDETDPATNGKCRQRYLEHLKETYPDDWCLVLDEDEILEENGIEKIKQFIQERKPGIYNVKMRHFIGDLGHEDATNPVHVVPGRLFKISEAKRYPLHSHPIIEGELMGACLDTTIWHLGYLPILYLDYIRDRAKQNANDTMIHTQKFVYEWKLAHLFGEYPKKQISAVELPKQILDRYGLVKDEFYFSNDILEAKHFIMIHNWLEFVKNDNPSIIDIGCGMAHFGFALKKIINKSEYKGIDKSKFIIQNSHYKKMLNLECLDITKNKITDKYFDLVLVIDVLEHLEYEELDRTINNFKDIGKKLIISIPFKNTTDFKNDPTHIIEEDKEWWIKKFTDKGLKLIPTPEHFLFKEQVMIFEK